MCGELRPKYSTKLGYSHKKQVLYLLSKNYLILYQLFGQYHGVMNMNIVISYSLTNISWTTTAAVSDAWQLYQELEKCKDVQAIIFFYGKG